MIDPGAINYVGRVSYSAHLKRRLLIWGISIVLVCGLAVAFLIQALTTR